jgi:outer membrane protein insertion porin family
VGYINLEQTNFDLFNPWNFTGGGQRFAANIRAGQFRRDLSISLTEPWFLDRQLALGGELYYRNALFFSDFFNQLNVGASIFIRKPINDLSFLRLDYRIENIELDADNTPNAAYFANLEDQYMRSAVGVSYTFDSRDSNQIPRQGHKIEAGLNYSGIGGDVNTVVLTSRVEKYWNLPGDTIFSVTGEFGVSDSLNDDEVPIFDRQFLGGPRTLRGFEFRDVGSINDGTRDALSQETIGGNTMGWVALEYTVPLFEQVRGAVFYDAGFLNADSWNLAPSDFYADAGFGIRLNLPLGPLAFDYAIPVTTPDPLADKGGQFNFYLDYKF